MPRVNKVETCMLCGGTPCECNVKTVPKLRAPRKNTQTSERAATNGDPPKKTASTSIVDAMRKAATVHTTAVMPKTERQEREALVKESDDISSDPAMCAAIRALAPLLHASEKRRYHKILESEPSVKDRALVWKSRKGER